MAFRTKAEKQAYRQGLLKGLHQKEKLENDIDYVATQRYISHMQRKFDISDERAAVDLKKIRKDIKKDVGLREELRSLYIPGYRESQNKS